MIICFCFALTNWCCYQKMKTYVKLSGKALELMQKQKDRLVKAYEEITKTISQDDLASMGATIGKITEIVKHTEG